LEREGNGALARAAQAGEPQRGALLVQQRGTLIPRDVPLVPGDIGRFDDGHSGESPCRCGCRMLMQIIFLFLPGKTSRGKAMSCAVYWVLGTSTWYRVPRFRPRRLLIPDRRCQTGCARRWSGPWP